MGDLLVTCPHGVDQRLRMETRIEGNDYVATIKHNLCPKCIKEVAERVARYMTETP